MYINDDGELMEHDNSHCPIEDYLKKYFYFQYNEVTSKLYWREVGKSDSAELTEYDVNTLIRSLKKLHIKCSKSDLIQILTSDFTPRFNPFHQYLNELPDWDNKTDHIANLASTLRTSNNQLWLKCFKKWIVGLVGSLIDDDVVNQTAPILCGGQGIGKTTWVGNLVPNELKDYFFSGSITSGSKDANIQISECMLIDMDELENITKKSIGDLKSIMTRKNINIRRPYGRVAETLPRRASFIGSINKKEFLKDETGSRRFLCFEVFDIHQYHEIEMSLVYSQALSLFKNGYRFWFDSKENQEVLINNEQFQENSLEMDLITRYFEPVPADKAEQYLMATDIASFLKERCGLVINSSTVQRIGKALSAKKFEQVTRKDRRVWAVAYKMKKAA